MPRRWIVASEMTFRLLPRSARASETSKRSVTPRVTNVVDWLTLRFDRVGRRHDVFAAAEQSALSWVKTAGTCAQIEPFDGVEREALKREAERHAARRRSFRRVRRESVRSSGSCAGTRRGSDRTDR